jgi:hypothetical protein
VAPVLLALPLLLELLLDEVVVPVEEGAGAEGRELLDWDVLWDEDWDWACAMGTSIAARASAPGKVFPRKKLPRLPSARSDASLQLPTIRNTAPLGFPVAFPEI